MEPEPKVIVAGGHSRSRMLNSVEMFNLSSGTWTILREMKECRVGTSSVICNDQLIVTGGILKTMEKLSIAGARDDRSTAWENVATELPSRLAGHCCVVHDGQLIVIGGYDAGEDTCSDSITEISLVQPDTSRVLATMQEGKCYHGVVLMGQDIVIVGGRENVNAQSALSNVVTYNITTSEFTELAPLPYPVYEMATVKWGDDNFLIIGGADSNNEPLNTVFMYTVKTQKSYVLPEMKYKRRGCVAAVVQDTVIVMGGKDENGLVLRSTECFRFDRFTWEELREMHDARCWATAAVC